ncbi:VIT domain-containing protein [Capnocytophaga leadbetteri]
MKHFLSSAALLLPFIALAQKTALPEVKVVNQRNANPMELRELSVDILVVGQTAITTMEMTFYNPNTRVMEGEFQFPLADGQQVSRFALDINGKMREGVVVDKALGRKAFEDIVRRGVDPGLLEKTEGNNFKARVYPMPAQGTRRVLIAFEQELRQKNGQDFYFLPVASALQLQKFKLRTEVVSRLVKADIENSLELDFKQTRNSYISELSKDNYSLNKNIALTFPKVEKPQVLTATKGSSSYLYGTMALGNTPQQTKNTPKKLGILWDVSHSAAQADKEKAFAFLNDYFSHIQNTEVTLNTFSIRTSEAVNFEVKNGNWQNLKAYLQTLKYDGATDGNAMNFNPKCDEYLLFTDGIFNFGAKDFSVTEAVKQIKTPITVINNSTIANTAKMQYLAGATGGNFIDLTTLSTAEAVKAACYTSFQLLGYEVKKGKVKDLYPEKGTALSGETFTFAGKLLSDEATIVVSVGYPNKVVAQQEISFSKDNATSQSEYALLRRVWAEKQIAHLQRIGADQKQIDAVGRQYGIVTEGNSLIVLETVSDYLRYRITPPKELLQEYQKYLQQEEEDKKESVKESLEEVIEQSADQTKWWQTSYPKKVKNTKNNGSLPSQYVVDGDTLDIGYEIAEVAPTARVAHKEERVANVQDLSDKDSYQLEEVVVMDNAPQRKTTMVGAISSNAAMKRSESYSEDTPEAPTGSIALNAYNPDTPYLKVMEYTDEAKAVETYYKLKEEYGSTPSFYADVADYFFKKGNKEQAILVISNLAELGLDDPQLLRMLGYKLSSYGAKKEAVQVFRKVAELREEEPQSFRDLGLALADDGQYNEAVKTLYKVVTGLWSSRFGDVQLVTMNDINSLIARHKGINTSYIDKRLLKKEPVDVRVVLSWDTDNCDMDLWVTDPKDEKCYYSNKLTYLGGKISEDVTQGYGPEEFMLKKAVKGKYKVQVDYFGTSSQKQLMPVSLRIIFYTHYGTPQQKQQETTVRLSNAKEVIEVGSFEF